MTTTLIGRGAGFGFVVAIAACSAAGDDENIAAPLGQIGLEPQSKPLSAAQNRPGPTHDPAGLLDSSSTNGFATGNTNGFFADLGTNRRTCGTCHVAEEGWTISAAGVRSRPKHDPIFAPFDGSDCPATSPQQGPNSALSTLLVEHGLIRIAIAIPPLAGFSLVTATNPQKCAIAPGSPAAGGQLFMFRRPLPSTNLVFDATIMFDGRETLQKITTTAGQQNLGPLLFNLNDQADAATLKHAQGATIAGKPAQADIVSFEMALATAQKQIGTGRDAFLLTSKGGNGGPEYIADVLAPAFFVGINDPLGTDGFTNANFTLYRAWEPTSPRYERLEPGQQAIGRGERIFNETTFTIHDVPGINSAVDNPLYNPNDPLAGKDVVAGCALCHNSPNIGNHSTSLPINIGVTMARPTNNDGSPNHVLDIKDLPVYTLRNSTTGATVKATDPGRALISGNWADIGKTKGPNLRGLSARAPYFHNGSASDLNTVVRFYNERFAMNLTKAQIRDLVAFLEAL